MKGLLLSAYLLLSVLLAKAQPPQCGPNETLIEDPPGNFQCESVIVACPGDGTTPESKRDYHDTATSKFKCCPTARQLVIYDQNSRVGVCCDAGKVYLGNAPNGLCCLPGQLLQGGKCVDPPPPGPPQGCPSQPNNVCNLIKACGDTNANGLQYGSCYQVAFPDGSGFGRGSDAAPNQYKMGGHVQNIPFKICKTTTDCGTGTVQAADSFYIQDSIGLVGDATGAVTWLSNAVNPNLVTATNTAAQAGQFKGQTSCAACKCVVSLTGSTAGLSLRGDQGNYGVSFLGNKQSVVDLQFSQVPCDNSVVVGAAPSPNAKVPGTQIPLVGKLPGEL
ncbi:hypothetical protein L218DRAFT_960043 [Marasmius fiardii PR-910]|nr:hypothetical protein L218DRAFT_960043 [Marasmius fiardii PR-910]